MKIKAKLRIGTGFLFSMIALLIVLSGIFIMKLANDTKNILVSNYQTVDYSRQMMNALERGLYDSSNRQSFLKNLDDQQHNITEIGEKDLTNKLSSDFELLRSRLTDSALRRAVQTDISDIMLLNMQAIQRKSKVAGETADNSIFWLVLVGTVCFLLGFVTLANLPGNIANPIRQLTSSIQEIAEKNYSQQLHFDRKDEFGELATAFNVMADKLEEYRTADLAKIMMEKKRIETLINTMDNPVIGLDEKGRVLFVNDTALKISGVRAEETIGFPIQDIAGHNDLIRSLVQDLPGMTGLSGKKEPQSTVVKIFADDKESYFEKKIIPINIVLTGERDPKLIGTVIFLQNITPYKELDFAKTNFIATVSHELKTPISSIQMGLQLLENKKLGGVNQEQQSLIEGIREDAGRLLAITGELLNMTQIENGSIALALVPTEADGIVNYAISANRVAAEERAITIRVDSTENLPLVQADKEKTAWVLTNLLSNAIRYSHENSVVSLRIMPKDNWIQFMVSDQGQGIAPQYIHRIFDRYFRVPGTEKQGTGLGLSISKEFIEAQGGTIAVESEWGVGSKFTVNLPVAKALA